MPAESLCLQCDRSSRSAVSLYDRHGAISCTCSALLDEYSNIMKPHTGLDVHVSVHLKPTQLRLDCGVAVVAATTVTGRTFN